MAIPQGGHLRLYVHLGALRKTFFVHLGVSTLKNYLLLNKGFPGFRVHLGVFILSSCPLSILVCKVDKKKDNLTGFDQGPAFQGGQILQPQT
jgi:hypothetical protein